MKTTPTLELIRAKQNAIQAEKDLKVAKENANREARIRTFAPLRQMLQEVIDLPAKSHHHASHRSIVRDHIYKKDLSYAVTFLKTWCGETSFSIRANEDGTFTLDAINHNSPITLEQAKDKIIEHLALIIK